MAVSRFNPDYPDAGLVLLNKTDFTGVSTVSVDNIFSSTYDNYKVIFYVSNSSSTGQLSWIWRNATPADLTSQQNVYWGHGESNTTIRASATNGDVVPAFTTNGQFLLVGEVANPLSSTSGNCRVNGIWGGSTSAGGGQLASGHWHVRQNNTEAKLGLKWNLSTGNMTGFVKIYGYKNEV